VITSQAVLIAIGIDWDGRGPSARGLDPWERSLAVMCPACGGGRWPQAWWVPWIEAWSSPRGRIAHDLW